MNKDLYNGRCECGDTFSECTCDKHNSLGYGVIVPASDDKWIADEGKGVVVENCTFENVRPNLSPDMVIHSVDRHSTLEERRIANINKAYPNSKEPVTAEGNNITKEQLIYLEESLEKESRLVTEAILDVMAICELNYEEDARKLIKDQFLVIDKQDIDELPKIDTIQSKLDQLRKENGGLREKNRWDKADYDLLTIQYSRLKHHTEEMAKAIENALKDHDNRTDAYKAYQMLKQALINFQKWIIAG